MVAKVFLSFFNGISNYDKIPVFYDGIIAALRRNGNSIMAMSSNGFMKTTPGPKNELLPQINKRKLLSVFNQFDPDILIAFNGSIPSDIIEVCQCPILIWEADSVTYFANQALLKRMASHVYFGSVSLESMSALHNSLCIPMNQMALLPFATDLKPLDVPQSINISFIGSYFHIEKVISDFIAAGDSIENAVLAKLMQQIEQEPFRVFPEIDSIYTRGRPRWGKLSDQVLLLNIISNSNRVSILNDLWDLGLKIYGTPSWALISHFSHNLALCYYNTPIYNVSQNEEVYNSSKICINISHAQTTSGLPWRIRDIMATNGCLVSDQRSDFSVFGSEVEIPVYRDKFEARKICQELLQDEPRRLAIVERCKAAIEKGHRFEHRFEQIRDFVKVNLLNQGEGTVTLLNPKDYLVCRIKREYIRIEKEAWRAIRNIKRAMHHKSKK